MTFYQTLTKAINDFVENGYDTEERLNYWLIQIKKAAIEELIPDYIIRESLEKSLYQSYERIVIKKQGFKNVSSYTIDKLKPKLRAELDRRILASANLIKTNKKKTVQDVLQRFQGWSTSIPAGGSKTVDKIEEKTKIRKSLSKMPFEQRRVIIDQTHKLISNINDIIAIDAGAIGAKWHSNWRQINYNYREDHKERDEKVYLVRNGWGYQDGYLKPVEGFTDEITMVGEEPMCRCRYVYLFSLSAFPKEYLTKKGEKALQSIYSQS
jgi:hypothetical protein